MAAIDTRAYLKVYEFFNLRCHLIWTFVEIWIIWKLDADMTPTVMRATYAFTASQQDPVRRTTSMATASVVKTKTVTRATRAQWDAALRLKRAKQAAALLKQVSDPTRLKIVLMLAGGERHVGALCEVLEHSQPATSHHLALLRHGGIIAPRRQGKNNFYALTEPGERLASIVKDVIG
jgi:DNA-binding transcriptional ArsR family regulator